MTAFCTEEDVREALQERSDNGPLGDSYIAPAIQAASTWLRNTTGGYWYDSGNNITDNGTVTIATDVRSASTDHLSVPSSPHPQENQVFASTFDRPHVRYPVTHAGRYARMRLPHRHIQTLTALEVRDLRGGVTDWVADSEFAEGRDADYYLIEQGVTSQGVTHLYINASSLGARENYDDLISAEYEYGLDWATDAWHDIRQGVANLAAAQVVSDDNVIAQIPDNGQLVGVATQYDQHTAAALGEAWSYLEPYMEIAIA